jgi:hypothetical protein
MNKASVNLIEFYLHKNSATKIKQNQHYYFKIYLYIEFLIDSGAETLWAC